MIADMAWFAAGLAAGVVHFALLRWNTALYGRAGRIGGAVTLQLLRLAVLGAVLAVIAMQGALPCRCCWRRSAYWWRARWWCG